MDTNYDILDYPDSYIPETIGYIKGMLETFSVFAHRDGYRSYAIAELVELPVKDKNQLINERTDGVTGKLDITEDYVAGTLERKLNKFFDDFLKKHGVAKEDNDPFINNWRYMFWRIADYVGFLEEKGFTKSCIKEKALIKNTTGCQDGVMYVFTIDDQYLFLLKIHDVKVPVEENSNSTQYK